MFHYRKGEGYYPFGYVHLKLAIHPPGRYRGMNSTPTARRPTMTSSATIRAAFLAALAATASAGTSAAATLVTYSFGTTTFSLNPTTTLAGLGAGPIGGGSGVSLLNSGVTLGTSTARALGVSGTGVSSTEAAAVLANRFFTFTLTPDAGQMISLQNITMNANLGGTLLPQEFSVRINTGTGYTTAAATVMTATSTSTGSPFHSLNLSLTEPVPGAYTNLTGPVSVQVVFYDTTSPATSWDAWVRMDDISIIGTVAPVPEAGSSMLALAGAGLLAARRRRCK